MVWDALIPKSSVVMLNSNNVHDGSSRAVAVVAICTVCEIKLQSRYLHCL